MHSKHDSKVLMSGIWCSSWARLMSPSIPSSSLLPCLEQAELSGLFWAVKQTLFFCFYSIDSSVHGRHDRTVLMRGIWCTLSVRTRCLSRQSSFLLPCLEQVQVWCDYCSVFSVLGVSPFCPMSSMGYQFQVFELMSIRGVADFLPSVFLVPCRHAY